MAKKKPKRAQPETLNRLVVKIRRYWRRIETFVKVMRGLNPDTGPERLGNSKSATYFS